jgi:cytochrome c peroxidase
VRTRRNDRVLIAVTLAAAASLSAARVLGADDAAAPEPLRGVDPAALGYTYAVGSFAPDYTPPVPGSYALPVVDTVGDHAVLDTDGHPTTLFALAQGRLAVVAFVYTTCVEATGCPISMAVLQRLDRRLAADPELARRVVLVTVSFDPERDTPERLATVRGHYRPQTDWRFVTTRSEAELAPLLDDFGQTVAKLRLADGRWSGLFRHVLKVFLVDPRQRVRNVYSVGFLDPTLVLNDLRTVLMEPPGGR